jgi:hypothetical protein
MNIFKDAWDKIIDWLVPRNRLTIGPNRHSNSLLIHRPAAPKAKQYPRAPPRRGRV